MKRKSRKTKRSASDQKAKKGPDILPASRNILNASRDLFSEHGFAETTVRMIARTARVNNAAICYYFRSKEQLYEAVFKESFASVEIGLNGLVDGVKDAATWRAAIDTWVGRILELFLSVENPSLVALRKLVIRERSHPTPQCENLLSDFFMPIIDVLRRLVDMAMPKCAEQEKQAAFVSFLGQCTYFLNHEKPWDKVLLPTELTIPEWIDAMRKQITGNILARIDYRG